LAQQVIIFQSKPCNKHGHAEEGGTCGAKTHNMMVKYATRQRAHELGFTIWSGNSSITHAHLSWQIEMASRGKIMQIETFMRNHKWDIVESWKMVKSTLQS
jgi:hypothetical protein